MLAVVRKWETAPDKLKKKHFTSAGIEPMTPRFDCPLLYQLQELLHEARQEQVMGDMVVVLAM